jgi:hypothetical protein
MNRDSLFEQLLHQDAGDVSGGSGHRNGFGGIDRKLFAGM